MNEDMARYTPVETQYRDGRWFNVRHYGAPEVNACRWCGIEKRLHAQRWVPGHGWHAWVEPTDALRRARFRFGGMGS